MQRITNVQVQAFLKDFAQYSETVILEEGAKKKEIIEIAKARGINLANNKDLAGFKTIYAFTVKANKNRARLPEDILVRALPGMIGKPVDIDHNRRYVIGHYIDYKYIQKKHMIIAYGVFYKSNFAEEWTKAKELFKKKVLSTSYEIWCPENKRNHLKDGTYELMEQEIAGGALLFKTEPAFEDAKVLEIAKTFIDKQPEGLVFAHTKYRCKDMLINGAFKCSHCGNCKGKKLEVSEAVLVEDTQVVETKTKCSNCLDEFTSEGVTVDIRTGGIKCPKCFAIVDKSGTMLYPPQIRDFKISCLSCRTRNWLILSKTDAHAKLKCLDCAKQFDVDFASGDVHKALNKFTFLYIGNSSCPQCNKSVHFSTTSHLTHRDYECPECKLSFPIDITKQQYRNIASIKEIIIDKLEKSGEGGKSKMEFKLEVSKFHRYFDGDIDKWLNEELIAEDYEKAGDGTLLVAKQLTSKEREELSDDSFAVVARVKNKETGKTRKVRMFLSNDEAHVSNVLSRLGQDKTKATLELLGVSVDRVLGKVLEKAKRLGMTEVLTQRADDCSRLGIDVPEAPSVEPETPKQVIKEENPLKKAVNKVAQKLISARKELASMKVSMAKKINFYKDNAKEIHERRAELQDFASELTDEQILNDKDFEIASLEKKLGHKVIKDANLNTSTRVGDKTKDNDYYAGVRAEINEKAFTKQ